MRVNPLFEPISIGAIQCPNRIFMAPLTRARATREHVPTSIMAEYYAQRAGAGLIFSEATAIGPQHMGWPFAPGIWSDEQQRAWTTVTDAVHEAGGRIVCQLWAMGRIVHPDFLNGNPPVSSSATTAPGWARTHEGKKPFALSRPLMPAEIAEIVEEYRLGARRAMAAGFDGVQIHAANGYLIDQFLRSNVNLRDDQYGGSITNRIRFLTEVVQAVSDEVGSDRTSVRLSPNGEIQGADDPEPIPLFGAAVQSIGDMGIASLELREPGFDGLWQANHPPVWPHLRKIFRGPLILNSEFDSVSAELALARNDADAISFGRLFIGNPDLPQRIAEGASLVTETDPETWYEGGAPGYSDYPALGSQP